MSEFFESEIVQDQLHDIGELQQKIYSDLSKFHSLSMKDRKEHIELLTELLEKQRLMYTRISLSDDPKAVEMKKQLQQSVQMLGFPEGTDIQVLFSGMKQTIESLRQQVD